MKFYLIQKGGEPIVKEAKSSEELKKRLVDNEYDPSDFEIITPKDYMDREIEAARLAEIKGDNPQLSAMFPRTAEMLAKEGKKPTLPRKAGSDDMLSLGGRSIGAIIDGIGGDNDFRSDYMESLSEKDSDDRDRGTLGGFLQGALRDEMLLPGMAIQVNKIPVIGPAMSNIGSKARNSIAKFLTQNIAKPAAEGAVGGSITGLARPLVTDDEAQIADDFLSGMVGNVVLSGAGKAIGKGADATGLFERTPEAYRQLLLELAHKNKAKPEFLDAAATPEGMAKMARNYGTQSEIAEDLVNYKNFSESNFPEYKQVQEFLENSQSTAKPDEAAESLTKFAERIMEKRGTGLNTDEAASAARLAKDAEMFYPPEPSSKLAEGQPRQVAEMNARQINDVRQSIGEMLADDFKRESAGKPSKEVQALKKAYGSLRGQLLEIAEKDGYGTAVDAYKSMANKLEAREALFDALAVPENKYVAQDRVSRKLTSIEGNEYKKQLQEALKRFDENFDADFSDRIKWMTIANELGDKAPGGEFQIKNDNNFMTGKGIRKELTDNFTGRTVKSALRKLEKARPRADAPPRWYRQTGGNPGGFRGNPITPQQQEMRDFIAETYGEDAALDYVESISYIPLPE